MFCPNCGTQNADENLFCQSCGMNFSEVQNINKSSTIRKNEPKPFPPVPNGGTNRSISLTNSSNFLESNGISIWGPFAGYGNQRDHKGWLVPGRGDRTAELIDKVRDKFVERQVKDAVLTPQTLSVRGVLEERRPYFLLMRKVATLGLYVSEFGKDLFVSIVSYIKPPISKFRAILLGVITFISVFGMMWWSGRLENSIGGSSSLLGVPSIDYQSIVYLICLAGPFITITQFALFLFILISFYKWLKEKDFWALLRMPVNEFNEDDLMAMEKAVEQTVRISLDEIGIPTDELIPIAREERKRVI